MKIWLLKHSSHISSLVKRFHAYRPAGIEHAVNACKINLNDFAVLCFTPTNKDTCLIKGRAKKYSEIHEKGSGDVVSAVCYTICTLSIPLHTNS